MHAICILWKAPTQRKNAAHGASRAYQEEIEPVPKGRKKTRDLEAPVLQIPARFVFFVLLFLALSGIAPAATKPHVISFGKWTAAQWQLGTGDEDDKPIPIKIRPLLVDGRIKEYTLGSSHEITDRIFVVRRAFRVNDGLPDDPTPRWQWQRGGWLLVDRLTGKVSAIALPDFDPLYSAASWYRDYTAYCGIADDGKKMYAIVAQLGRRKPVLKKLLSDNGIPDEAAPDSACPAPLWQRNPARVSFEPTGAPKQTFAIRGHVVDVVNDDDED